MLGFLLTTNDVRRQPLSHVDVAYPDLVFRTPKVGEINFTATLTYGSELVTTRGMRAHRLRPYISLHALSAQAGLNWEQNSADYGSPTPGCTPPSLRPYPWSPKSNRIILKFFQNVRIWPELVSPDDKIVRLRTLSN